MPEDPRVVFVFDEADVYVFPSLRDAAQWMESVDVDSGEYIAALTEAGQVISMRTEDHLVVLELTSDVDTATLHRLLREHGQRIGAPGIEQDPVGFANRTWQREWELRWPRWPGWLDKRLHPRGPFQT